MKDNIYEFVNKHYRLSVLFFYALIGFTILHWLILVFQIPIFDSLPYWEYRLHVTPIASGWVLLTFFIFTIAAWFCIFTDKDEKIKLVFLLLIGVFIQYGLMFSVKGEHSPFIIRFAGQGHAEFAKVSVRQLNMLTVARNYEIFITEKFYGFLPSKPPGTLLFYMASEKIASAIWPTEDKELRLVHLAKFASLTWPLLSCLAVIPLYFLARYLFEDPSIGIMAVLFYISTPALNLITLITDQTLYPLLCLTSVLLVFIACRWNSILLAIVGGVFFYFILYFSFGLVVVGFFFCIPILISFPNLSLRSFKNGLRSVVGIVLGVLIADIFAYRFLNYNIFIRYAGAMENHLRWKQWDNSFDTYIKSGFTNLTEFSVWVGLPLILLFIVGAVVALKRFVFQKPDAHSFFTIVLISIFMFLLLFGKTKAEVARLWLFLIPFLCLSISSFILHTEMLTRHKKILLIIILLLEMGTTILTLGFQNYS